VFYRKRNADINNDNYADKSADRNADNAESHADNYADCNADNVYFPVVWTEFFSWIRQGAFTNTSSHHRQKKWRQIENTRNKNTCLTKLPE